MKLYICIISYKKKNEKNISKNLHILKKSTTFALSKLNIKTYMIMEKFIYKNALKEIGVTYVGATKQSAKMNYSYNNGTETYCIYLAPSTMSGRNVCPNSEHCKEFCLNGSGRNKSDILLRGEKHSNINVSRIKKTDAFYKQRDLFMQTIIHEINTAMKRAEKNGMEFSVRLNGTSDLSPLVFKYQGKNILEWFPNVQFYDYTKVPSRYKLLSKYKNYDLTFSFDGHNWDKCEEILNQGGKVAVIFENEKLPTAYKGYNVIDANGYDMRYLDPKGTIMGLHYHRTANDYKSGKYVKPVSKAIITIDDENCMWEI